MFLNIFHTLTFYSDLLNPCFDALKDVKVVKTQICLKIRRHAAYSILIVVQKMLIQEFVRYSLIFRFPKQQCFK